MSFAQLHAATATAAADSAYLQDVREVQRSLQQLRRRASAVHTLRRFYGGKPSHRQASPALRGDQQVLQHQQQLECELEAARSAADSVRRALLQLQQHIGAAASASEKYERQMYYSQLINTAGHLLHQLRDAAEDEGWLLQQQHELLSSERIELQTLEQKHAIWRREEAEQALQHGQRRSVGKALQSTCDSTGLARGTEIRGSASAADGTSSGENGWHVCDADFLSSFPLASAPTASSPVELAPGRGSSVLPWPQSGVCPGPLQWQHQLLQANKSVPIFIPDSKIDASLLQEKRESLARIQGEIRSIQSLYEQMAFFTEVQGERLDAVDHRLVGARQEAARAAREVAKAVREERRRKCRRCLFVSSMFLILLFFGFALWWNATP